MKKDPQMSRRWQLATTVVESLYEPNRNSSFFPQSICCWLECKLEPVNYAITSQ